MLGSVYSSQLNRSARQRKNSSSSAKQGSLKSIIWLSTHRSTEQSSVPSGTRSMHSSYFAHLSSHIARTYTSASAPWFNETSGPQPAHANNNGSAHEASSSHRERPQASASVSASAARERDAGAMAGTWDRVRVGLSNRGGRTRRGAVTRSAQDGKRSGTVRSPSFIAGPVSALISHVHSARRML